MTFFDCTVDLVGQLNADGQKRMLQIDEPLSKISGYATVYSHLQPNVQILVKIGLVDFKKITLTKIVKNNK